MEVRQKTYLRAQGLVWSHDSRPKSSFPSLSLPPPSRERPRALAQLFDRSARKSIPLAIVAALGSDPAVSIFRRLARTLDLHQCSEGVLMRVSEVEVLQRMGGPLVRRDCNIPLTMPLRRVPQGRGERPRRIRWSPHQKSCPYGISLKLPPRRRETMGLIAVRMRWCCRCWTFWFQSLCRAIGRVVVGERNRFLKS